MSAYRKFDYDQARRLRQNGWTYTRIGELLDVSPEAVRIVLDADAGAKNAASRRRFQQKNFWGTCPRCGTVRVVNIYQRDRDGLCRSCLNAARVDERVTATEALCSRCGEWKPHGSFTLRRGLPRTVCRPCDTEAKRDWRRRNPAQSDVSDTTSLVWKKARRRVA